jgi:hypothetical protein
MRGDVWRIKGSKRGFEGAPSSQESAVIIDVGVATGTPGGAKHVFAVPHER